MSPDENDYLSLRIDPDLKVALKRAADREGRSVGNLVKHLIRLHCDKEGFLIQEKRGDYKVSKKK